MFEKLVKLFATAYHGKVKYLSLTLQRWVIYGIITNIIWAGFEELTDFGSYQFFVIGEFFAAGAGGVNEWI